MSCDGFNHGARVVAIESLPELRVLRGAIGHIRVINRVEHKIDVEFEDGRLLRALPARGFRILEEPTGRSHAGAPA